MLQVRVSNRIFIKRIKTVHMYFGLTVNLFLIWATGILFLFIPSICIKTSCSRSTLFIFCPYNRTEWSPEWSPIQSVIIQVINKYDYRQNWTTRSPDTN